MPKIYENKNVIKKLTLCKCGIQGTLHISVKTGNSTIDRDNKD